MPSTWIVSANANKARIFNQSRNSSLEEIDTMVNPAARLKAADIETDQLGQHAASKSAHGVGSATQPSGYEPNQLPMEHQTEIFARELAAYLFQQHQQGRFQQLSLVVAPQFLGLLRRFLHPTVAAALNLELNKDYTQFSAKELSQQLRDQRH